MLVGELLDGRGDDACRADAVGAHPDRLLVAVLVEVARAQRLGVAGAELEDVADLDRRLSSVTRLAAERVAVACIRSLPCCARTTSALAA